MPKATFKKKKYNARFPPARIKKIMQMDEEVGKVAAAVPVIISRALEMFIESLVTETSKVTLAKNAKTLSTSHIKQTITGQKQFDFLQDLVKNVPDHQAEDNGESSLDKEPSLVKRGRGRPRNMESCFKALKKSRGNKTSSEEEDEDDDEDTETDEESTNVKQNVPELQPDNKPNIDQLIKAASSLQQHHHPSPLQPFTSDHSLSHNNNNNNLNNNNNSYVPSPAAGSASYQGLSTLRDSLISGKNRAPVLHHQSLPLSPNCVPPSPLSQIKPPDFDTLPSSHFSSQLPSKVSFYNSSSSPHHHPSHIQSPVSQKLSQQQQPIDLSHPLRQNIVKEEDDYDT